MSLMDFLPRLPRSLEDQADTWERRHGSEEAVRLIRERIGRANRAARRHLYRLHDEIARRISDGDRAASA